jgi:hypothetical protein
MSTLDLKTTTAPATAGDGFDNYTDHVEGDDSPQQQGILRGTHLKFDATAQWERRDGEVIGPEVKLIVTDIARAVLKWGPGADKKPPETTIIPPGVPFPDVDAMNEATSKDQWRQGPAGLQGPFQVQQAVYMLEPVSMETFTFTTSSIGGFIAVRDLVDKVRTMRRYRGAVSPIVTLGDTAMRTRFGERRRPHFSIVDWVRMGGSDEPQQAVLPAPHAAPSGAATVIETAPVIEASPAKVEPAGPVPAVKPAKKRKSKSSSFDHVPPLTVNEELNDEIGF